MLTAAIVLFVAGASAQAEPPQGSNGRYAAWFAQLKSKDGISCCDIADCRFVTERIVGGRYQVRFHDPSDTFPQQWVMVPDDAVRPRPPGGPTEAVACWVDERIYCFFGEPES
jgi:hypothetical protein